MEPEVVYDFQEEPTLPNPVPAIRYPRSYPAEETEVLVAADQFDDGDTVVDFKLPPGTDLIEFEEVPTVLITSPRRTLREYLDPILAVGGVVLGLYLAFVK